MQPVSVLASAVHILKLERSFDLEAG